MKCILIDLFQGSYSVAIVLDSVIAYRNKGYANIRIGAAEQGVPTYSLTINNLLSFGANNYACLQLNEIIVNCVRLLKKLCLISI